MRFLDGRCRVLVVERRESDEGRVGDEDEVPHLEREWDKFMQAYGAKCHIGKQRAAPEQGDYRLFFPPDDKKDGGGEDKREKEPQMPAGNQRIGDISKQPDEPAFWCEIIWVILLKEWNLLLRIGM